MKQKYATGLLGLLFITVGLITVFAPGCKKDEQPVNDLGYGYFPTAIGRWVIYEVDSTVYDDFQNDTDVYRYQVKEFLESSFMDNEGRPSIRVERYKRWYNPNLPYDSIPWYLSRVWAFTKTNIGAEKLEENQRFIRLVFGVSEGKTWDGNAYNTIGQWMYKYTAVDVPYSINSFSFDSTLVVEQKKEVNWLNHREYTERYARNVGLIEKSIIDVSDDSVFVGIPVLNRINSGVVCTIKLVDYGPR